MYVGESTTASGDVTKQCVQYNKEMDKWLPLPPSTGPVLCTSAVYVQDAMLVMFMGGEEENKKKVYGFDLNNETWTTLPDMLQGIFSPIVACIKHFVYVTFSTYPENEEERRGSEISLQCFDATTATWSFKAPLPNNLTEMRGAKAVTLEGLLYVIGGYGNVCLRYKPDEDTWTVLAPPLQTHGYGAALALNKRIILCGGMNRPNDKWESSDSIEEYDPSTNTWKLLPVKLPKPLYLHAIIQA